MIQIFRLNYYFIQRSINIDLLLTVYYLVLQLKKTKTIFIITNGLNGAKDLLISAKVFQGIGVIYISEIENWDKIKNESYWTNVILTDSTYPIAAKHFAFGFETTDLHNLLNFEYSLLNDQGKLLEFKQGEDEIPALNFTIQVI